MTNKYFHFAFAILLGFSSVHAEVGSTDKEPESAEENAENSTPGNEDGTESAEKEETTDSGEQKDAKAADEKAADEKAADEKAADEKAADEKASDEKASDEKAGDEKADEKAGDKKKPELTEEEKKKKKEKAEAKAKKRKSKYPISGSVSTSYSGNHANFVDSNGDFGVQILTIGGNISYKAHKHLTLRTGVNGRKSIVNDFFSAGSASTTNEQPWEIGDVSVSAGFGKLYTIPVADISISAAASATVPLSRTSRSFGLITSTMVSTVLGWSYKTFNLGLTLNAGANVLETPTVQVDCTRAPDVCRIAGSDSGIPLNRISYGGNLSASYSLFDSKLSLSTGYGLGSGFSSIEVERDEFSSAYAQSGKQYSMAFQNFNLGVSYTFNKKTSVSLSSVTAGPVYTNDNQAWRFPLFDTESDLHHRTQYTLSVSHSF